MTQSAAGHIDRWCQSRGIRRGATLTPDQAWRLPHGWYKDKLKPEWRRHTVDEAEALIASVGLAGAFWNLRA